MSGSEVENAFYPPSNIRKKSEDIMPHYEAIYTRINQEGSKANLYFMWLRYKREHPSSYQYTQFCHYFNQYVNTHHGAQNFRMAVERIPEECVYILTGVSGGRADRRTAKSMYHLSPLSV
jgi:hypothetical protein